MTRISPPPAFTYIRKSKAKSKKAQPVWEIAESFPWQGEWSEEDYLALPEDGRRIELVDGFLEFLPMPTMLHEEIVAYIYELLKAYVRAHNLGRVFFSGIRVNTVGGKFRIPDIVFMLREHANRMKNDAWEGADLVMEVVSPDDSDRDWKRKRTEYAKAGIPEYWIIDPQCVRITVFRLEDGKYVVSGEYGRGAEAASVLLNGFVVDVTKAFDGEARSA